MAWPNGSRRRAVCKIALLLCGRCLFEAGRGSQVGLSVDSQRAVVCAFLGWWVHLTSGGSEVEEKLGRWTDSPEQGPQACHAGRKAPYSWWHSSVWVIDLSCCFHFFTGWQVHSLNRMCVCVCVCARARAWFFSCVQLSVTPWTVACQTPLSTGFFRQEHWSGWPFPSHRTFPIHGFNPGVLHWRYILYLLSHHRSPLNRILLAKQFTWKKTV